MLLLRNQGIDECTFPPLYSLNADYFSFSFQFLLLLFFLDLSVVCDCVCVCFGMRKPCQLPADICIMTPTYILYICVRVCWFLCMCDWPCEGHILPLWWRCFVCVLNLLVCYWTISLLLELNFWVYAVWYQCRVTSRCWRTSAQCTNRRPTV